MEKIRIFFKHPILLSRSKNDNREGVIASRELALKLFEETKNERELEIARTKLLKAASLGDKAAIIKIAECYKDGSYGFRQNPDKSLHWFGYILQKDSKLQQQSRVLYASGIVPSNTRLVTPPSDEELKFVVSSCIELLGSMNDLKKDGNILLNSLRERNNELNGQSINNEEESVSDVILDDSENELTSSDQEYISENTEQLKDNSNELTNSDQEYISESIEQLGDSLSNITEINNSSEFSSDESRGLE